MHAQSGVQKILLANKSDMEQEKIITKEQGEEIASANKMKFYETSARTGQGIKEAFENIAREIIKGIEEKQALKTP